MKQEQKVWIRGIKGRGQEVIQKLEELGGKNINRSYGGNCQSNIYFITHNYDIYYCEISSEIAEIIMENYKELKLTKIKKEYNFEPFDKVLVRDSKEEIWRAGLFSHYYMKDNIKIAGTITCGWEMCIPYNEKTKHLIGTTDNFEEE